MRIVTQRVIKASVSINDRVIGEIKNGLLVLLAIHQSDQAELVEKMVEKLIKLRIFSDSEDKMNLSIADIKGEMLVVSQFTLYADAKKGNRPSFTEAADPKKAKEYYLKFIDCVKAKNIKVATGEFGAMMKVGLVNDGPVTIILDL